MARKTITEKYLEALKSFDDWAPVSEWAMRVCEIYPDLLEKANEEARNQAQDTTGLREIAARISSNIARGAYAGRIEIDSTERPRKVRYITPDEYAEQLSEDAEEDLAPLRRIEVIKRDWESLSQKDKYRMEEFQAIAKHLKLFNGLEFELDHAQALLSNEMPGKHHPDNVQFLLKLHNAKKSNSNWQRFTIDEQIEYIETVVKLQSLVAENLGIEVDKDIFDSLIRRLRNVFD